ncbi:hypothetical protein V8D89_005105 [Ganoderma adspersum]
MRRPHYQDIPAGLPTGTSDRTLHVSYANTLTPINRLPPELLHMVFKQAATLPEVVEHFDWRCVITLTHVCRLWRTMVVEESRLWSHIHTKSRKRCVKLFIARSSGLPLTVYTFLNLDEVELLDTVLFCHKYRVRAVHLDHDPGLPPRWQTISVIDRFLLSAPQVECFVLNGSLERPEEEPIDWRIFAHGISPLKALRISLVHLWDRLPPNSFPNLTHLLLGATSSTNHPINSLLTLLSRVPMLQYLHLITAEVAVDPASDPPLSLVSLPHIRTVSIHFTALESAFFLLRHLDLPAECAVCLTDSSSSLDFDDPSTFPRADALDIPPLPALNTITALDLSASCDGFLLAGHNAPHFTAGFVIEGAGCSGHGAWLARLHTMLPRPFANTTILHANLDDLETAGIILTAMLWHLPRLHELCCLLRPPPARDRAQDTRALVEVFLAILRPTSTPGPDAPCPNLQVLGLEAELAHEDFPFLAIEYTAAARRSIGCPLRRFVFHSHTRRHDGAGTRALFAASFAPLAALVDEVEYRRAGDERVCPFRSPRGGCWDVCAAERYWELPGRMMLYGWDPDLDLGWWVVAGARWTRIKA